MSIHCISNQDIQLTVQKFKTIDITVFCDGDTTLCTHLNKTFNYYYSFVKLTNKIFRINVSSIISKCLLLENVQFRNVLYDVMCILPDEYIYT